VPKTIKRALEIDKENGKTLWRDAIAKEMQAVKIAFKILEEGQQAPPASEWAIMWRRNYFLRKNCLTYYVSFLHSNVRLSCK